MESLDGKLGRATSYQHEVLSNVQLFECYMAQTHHCRHPSCLAQAREDFIEIVYMYSHMCCLM